jgi:hypothetical protein
MRFISNKPRTKLIFLESRFTFYKPRTKYIINKSKTKVTPFKSELII